MSANFNIADLFLVAPALSLFFASLVPLAIKVLRGNREPRPFAVILWAFIGIVAATGFNAAALGTETQAFMKALSFDGLAFWGTQLVLFILAFALVFAREHLETCTRQFTEFTFLLLNSTVGMMVVLWSNDLIVTFIGIEIMSLCIYLLIAMSHGGSLSKEAALKYFVLGSFGSAIFLYGVSFLFGTASSSQITEISSVAAGLVGSSRLFVVGLGLVLIGFSFKVGIVPFHAWSPDVYQGAPTPMTAFMAAGVKVAVFVVSLRLIATHFLIEEKAGHIEVVLEWLAVASMMLGNIAALLQTSVKRMLAYSSIAHSGYVLVGLIAAGLGGEAILGANAVLFYVFSYSLVTLGTFGFVSLFETKEGREFHIADLKGLAKKDPWSAAFFTILLLSLAGIPPTLGFFGKLFIFSAAIKQGMFWVAVWGVVSSVISVYFYLKPIVFMYMEEPQNLTAENYAGKETTQIAVGALSILALVLGFFSQSFYDFIQSSLGNLF